MPSFLRGCPRGRAAFAVAVECHAGQRRPVDCAPFVLHPLQVATLLYASGCDDATIAAGLLHDVLEKTATTPETLAVWIGDDVAATVATLTEDATIDDDAARKAEHRARISAGSDDGVLVFAADKLAKARELRHATLPPGRFELVLEHYAHSLEIVAQRLADHALVEQLRFELETLRTFPPVGPHER